MSESSALFDANHPPLLKTVKVADIIANPVVAGAATEAEGVFAVHPWDWLNACGGRLLSMDGGIYLGIWTPQRGALMNSDGPRPYVNESTPIVIKAKVRQTPEWHMVEAPMSYATQRVLEITESFSSELSTLTSFQSVLEESVEATVGASGFGMSAEVTAGLKSTVTNGIEMQQSIIKNHETKSTETIEAGATYATWLLYTKVETTFGAEIVGDWKPLSTEQMAGINPGVQTYYVLKYTYEDMCLTKDLPGG